jgi:hypothetical protein
MANKKQLVALLLSGLVGFAQAGEKEELLKLRNTTTNLIKQLVKQGVITEKMADEMIKQAEAEASQQVAQAAKEEPSAKAAQPQEQVPADEVRIAYVPDFVKDDIRKQVRTELREEVVNDVMQKAKQEQWGMPNALPEWTKRFKLSGDLRLREQLEFMGKDNTGNGTNGSSTVYPDWMAINDRLGAAVDPADAAALNTTNDRNRIRERLRIGMDVAVAEGLNAGIRLATGNIRNPVSTNQTLGNTGDRYDFRVDRAFLKYDLVNDNKFNWLSLAGGRIQNPWFTGGSELVWDEDLSFEGVAATVRYKIGSDDSMGSKVGNNGPTIFATGGVFPLQESGFSSKDKWLFGGQTGLDWGFNNQDNLKISAGYFDYSNITARSIDRAALNTCDQANQNTRFSAPQFMQFGNSLAVICQGASQTNLSGLVGLASDFKIVNINAAYDMALFAPIHLKLSGDFAKNVGFNQADISKKYKTVYGAGNLGTRINDASDIGWQVKADLGWPRVDMPGNWSVFTLYRHLGSDAVLDAYTDSDFHLGGTNTKGWMIGGNYGLMKNVWLTGRWLSADVITGPKYSIDVLQLDLNTRF